MDKKTVRTIAHLSRLTFEEKNEEKITNDVDTADIEPLTSPLEKTAKTRSDNVNAENRKEVFLNNAPSSNEDYILVPRVVE
jgi:aspartyl-tRNA(Asn)/glutamyl-tRNA(Gln) amidotransferase subunit C